jgi:DNA-binding Xre family transcriptional regulator
LITYEPFFKTLREKKISTYHLITYCNVSRGLIDRLKHDRPITTVTLNDLCKLLECNISDVIEFRPDILIQTPEEKK